MSILAGGGGKQIAFQAGRAGRPWHEVFVVDHDGTGHIHTDRNCPNPKRGIRTGKALRRGSLRASTPTPGGDRCLRAWDEVPKHKASKSPDSFLLPQEGGSDSPGGQVTQQYGCQPERGSGARVS